MRSELLEHGVLRRCLFQLEVYRQRALRCLDDTGGLEPAHGRLRAMIDAVSPFATE